MVSLVKIVIFCTSWIQANGFICIISFNLHKRHRRDCYPPHFTDGKTEAHRGYEKICPRPYHYKVSVWFSIVNALKLPLDSSCAEKNPFSPSPSLFASSPEDGIFSHLSTQTQPEGCPGLLSLPLAPECAPCPSHTDSIQQCFCFHSFLPTLCCNGTIACFIPS